MLTCNHEIKRRKNYYYYYYYLTRSSDHTWDPHFNSTLSTNGTLFFSSRGHSPSENMFELKIRLSFLWKMKFPYVSLKYIEINNKSKCRRITSKTLKVIKKIVFHWKLNNRNNYKYTENVVLLWFNRHSLIFYSWRNIFTLFVVIEGWMVITRTQFWISSYSLELWNIHIFNKNTGEWVQNMNWVAENKGKGKWYLSSKRITHFT